MLACGIPLVTWLLVGLALAGPEDPLPRLDEPLTERRFARLVGDGPAWGAVRRRSGPVTAWIFADGVVEHAEIWSGRKLGEVRRYDAGGHLLTTIAYEEGTPARVTVHRPTETVLDVGAWTERPLEGVTLRWPAESPDHHLRAEVVPSEADPTSAEFLDGLRATCACLVEDRTTAWLQGRPGVRYSLRVADPEQSWTGELWATSDGHRTLLLTALVPATADGLPEAGPDALALGRAVAALARWEDR